MGIGAAVHGLWLVGPIGVGEAEAGPGLRRGGGLSMASFEGGQAMRLVSAACLAPLALAFRPQPSLA